MDSTDRKCSARGVRRDQRSSAVGWAGGAIFWTALAAAVGPFARAPCLAFLFSENKPALSTLKIHDGSVEGFSREMVLVVAGPSKP